MIFVSIDLICRNPKIGKSIAEVNDRHRKHIVGSHIIIYKIENNLILIDRVLHQRMDIENQLL